MITHEDFPLFSVVSLVEGAQVVAQGDYLGTLQAFEDDAPVQLALVQVAPGRVVVHPVEQVVLT